MYDFGHGGPGFPVWHRYYLMWYERELRWMLGRESDFVLPFWDWSSEKNRMYPFKEHVYGASDEAGTLFGNFANWTTVCTDQIDHICDPTESNGPIKRFRTHQVYEANYTKWPRREEICEALSIPVYDSPPYNTIVEATYSFRNFMEGFYVGNESCDSNRFDCTSNTTRLQLHNQVCKYSN